MKLIAAKTRSRNQRIRITYFTIFVHKLAFLKKSLEYKDI